MVYYVKIQFAKCEFGGIGLFQLKYLFIRALRGYVFLIPILIGYFLLLIVFRRKQKPLHIATCFVFSFYLFFIIAATGIGNTAELSFSPEILMIPFRDIVVAPLHFTLNIVAFIPFGVFLPLLYKRYSHFGKVALAGFLFSLCIELVQMFGWGATEIDDLIANTLGVCLGHISYCLMKKSLCKNLGESFRSVDINDTVELVLLTSCTFLIMALVQPLIGNSILVV